MFTSPHSLSRSLLNRSSLWHRRFILRRMRTETQGWSRDTTKRIQTVSWLRYHWETWTCMMALISLWKAKTSGKPSSIKHAPARVAAISTVFFKSYIAKTWSYFWTRCINLKRVCLLLWECLMIFLLSSNSPEDYVDSRSAMPPDLEKPDCAKAFELPYSIHAFQHLRVSRGQSC